ncbi:MAG: hypothetical protein NTY19_03655 [Planctomycetota bacterium]|nr:hypothetical protein [Planctomycetota bacterium]
MNSSPVFLDSITDRGRTLTRITSSPGDAKNEGWLQELLFGHPELLPIDEFDDSFAPPIAIGREVQTRRGPLDNLYVSPAGGLTIVETKLWKNPEKHRTVVAQIIDYAKELATWSYDDLCEAVLASSRRRGEVEAPALEDKIRPALDDRAIPLADFQDSVVTNLDEGNFLLLIVGDRIAPNITLLSDAIQSGPGLGFQLGLVEMRMYPLANGKDWPLVVVPDVVGRTVEKVRGIVRIRYTQEKKPDVSVETDEEDRVERPGKMDLDLFLSEIPKDLVSPYRAAIERWESSGGGLLFTNRMIHFTKSLNGESRRIIRCELKQVQLVTRAAFDRWCNDPTVYETYLDQIDQSAVVANIARGDKQWIRYAKIGPSDLQVLLDAGMSLAETIAGREKD